MSRYPRSFHLLLVVALLTLGLTAAERPSAVQAAGTFVVTTTRDLPGSSCGSYAGYSSYCSLRQALNAAIASGGNATINFDILSFEDTGAGTVAMPGYDGATETWTILLGFIDSVTPIDPDQPLPPITVPGIVIDGDSQATARGISAVGPRVFIDGTHVDNQGGITVISTSGTRIERLGIINFGGNPSVPGDLDGVGIELFNATGATILGSSIGVNQAGTGAAPNDAAGILIQGGSGNTIGGNNSENDEYNVISGNTNDGILIRQAATGTVVIGNRIGVNTNGTAAIPNGQNGIQIELASANNRIGPIEDQPTNDSTARNIIAGNGGYGVFIDGTNGNIINGNWIGANNSLNVRLPNQSGGILIQSSSSNDADSNKIGGNTSTARNIIAGNNGPGVTISGPNASGNAVANNWIGVGFNGSTVISNTIGVSIVNGGDENSIGGLGTATRNNVIAGNTSDGIRIAGSGTGIFRANGNIVSGNLIGVASNGTTALPNGGNGVSVLSNVHTTQIGGETLAAANRILNNAGDGIRINGSSIFTSTIQLNTIQKNTGNGVFVSGAVNTKILGGGPSDLSQITQNTQNGVYLTGSSINQAQYLNLSTNTQNGLRVTSSPTTTVDLNTVLQNQANGVLLEGALLDTTITSNTVLTNTLSGITGSGSWTNTAVTSNVVRGQGGSGIRIDGPATDTQISGNTVYTNTVTASPESHGIWLGSGLRAIINSNNVRGNTNGAGIVMGAVADATISANPEVNRNGLEGIRVTGASKPQIAGNTVISNTQQVAGLGGIVLATTTDASVTGNTVRGHTGDPGIALSVATGSLLQANNVTKNQTGLDLTGGFNTAVRGGSYSTNTLQGIQVTGTDLMTMTDELQLVSNGGSGARILGGTTRVIISDTLVLNNAVNGIQIGGGGAAPHPQRVTLLNNSITGNGIPRNASGVPTIPLPVATVYQGLGVVFNPEGPAELAANPNHDINPPSSISLSSNGIVTGRVSIADGVSGCIPASQCRVQVFRADPATRDGQGRDLLGTSLADATGAFTVTVGTLPVQLAVNATDGAGNTSRFGLFTGSPDLSIGPAGSSSVKPSQVATYVHTVSNTGNMTFNNLQVSATSSRGWDEFTISPAGQFSLGPGQTRTITVSVKLPIGSDPRSAAGGLADNMTVTVQGSVQFEGEATPRIVSRSVVNVTTVLASVVLELTPAGLSGRGLPGSVLPYVHTLRNSGNISATVSLTASTDLGGAWVTTLTPSGSLTLLPGAQQAVQVLVNVPARSTGVTSGTVALTTLRLTTVSPVDATQNRIITDTTTVTLDQAASLITDEVVDGVADEVVTISHRVTNLSNGPATFRLAYSSSLGSTVTFRSATSGVTIGANSSFTLGTQALSSPPNQLDFFADVKVNRDARGGQKDSIIIYLLDSNGNVVGGAFVRDTVNVTRGAILPKFYAPLMLN